MKKQPPSNGYLSDAHLKNVEDLNRIFPGWSPEGKVTALPKGTIREKGMIIKASPVLELDDKTKKRLTRHLGERGRRVTAIIVEFDLFTPLKDCGDPAKDEVLIIDMLDAISNHAMGFHDIPGFRLKNLTINGSKIL